MTGAHPMPTPPSSVPAGLRVDLFRARVRAGESGTTDRWMAMLNDRLDECVDTLDRERMALELVFRHRDADGDWLYWVCVRGPEGADDLDHDIPVDRDHAAYLRRCTDPRWERADPQLLLAPAGVRAALLSFAGVPDRPHP